MPDRSQSSAAKERDGALHQHQLTARLSIAAFLLGVLGVVLLGGLDPTRGDASAPGPTSSALEERDGPVEQVAVVDTTVPPRAIGGLTTGRALRTAAADEAQAEAQASAAAAAESARAAESATTVPPTTALPVVAAPTTAPPTTAPPTTAPPTTTPAPPPVTTGVWDSIAACETGGNWAINSGNGYYGGLQFLLSTWQVNGGTQYAAYPHQASREQQIAVGERVVAAAGGSYGAWGSCASRLGLP